jgi:hypothetical protein
MRIVCNNFTEHPRATYGYLFTNMGDKASTALDEAFTGQGRGGNPAAILVFLPSAANLSI